MDNSGWTPLHLAASGGYTCTSKLLLENNANRNMKNDTGETPLQVAQRRFKDDVVRLLETWDKSNFDSSISETTSGVCSEF